VDTDDTRNPNVNGARASERDWQWLWFSTLQRRPGSALAVVPGDGDVKAGRVAEAVVAVGRLYGERPVQLLNAEGVGLGDVEKLLDALSAMTGRGEWVIVPVDPIALNPAAIPIARATSAALLVVRVGESRLAAARSTIEAVGRERLLGSVVLEGA